MRLRHGRVAAMRRPARTQPTSTKAVCACAATKANIANLKADIERAKWQIILAVGGIVALITLIERWPG